MKLSLEWLKQYVDLPHISPEKIAGNLTMKTAEVEGIEILRRIVKGIVVGEIIDIEPIDTVDREKIMNYVTVDLGSETLKSVCGAPNVQLGMKSPFAIPGTVIAHKVQVERQELYGHQSEGILCSPKELGWGESHLGILAFQESLSVGTELSELVPAEDHIIEIDNKSVTHRPDLWGHYGFARELAAIFNKELKSLDMIDAGEGSNLPAFPLRLDDTGSCPGYCCLDIDGLRPAFSPVSIQYRLLAIGQRPINLLVDLTNYIMFELGQPMHAFDGGRVRDIIVAPFGGNGTFRTLDSIDRDMEPGDCMICDHTGPIALAGIMGGEETEVKEDTTRILLESANFNPARIRRTALRLGLRSEASQRFEKGQPPCHMKLSIRRFVKLLRDASLDAELMSQITSAGDTGEKSRPLIMNADVISDSIGVELSTEKIGEILGSLGFGCSFGEDIRIEIPPHRSKRDISIPRDIVEEVARIYGYDNVAPAMPQVEMKRYMFNAELRKQHKIRRYLSEAKHFNEVHTYSWYDDVWLKRIGYEPDGTLVLRNPATEDNSRMRSELLPNLLSLVDANAVHRDRFFLYEVGNVYRQVEDGCEQPMHCAGIGYESEKTGSLQNLFLYVKGAVGELIEFINAGTPSFELSDDTSLPWLTLGCSMDIILNGKPIGRTGYLAAPFLDVYEKGTQVVWFEFSVDELAGSTYPDITYHDIPVYPGSWMDFSILADTSIGFTGLEDILKKVSHPILKKHKFCYLFDGKGLPEGKISYTFRFWLGLQERTLTGEDLVAFRNMFLQFLESHGLSLR